MKNPMSSSGIGEELIRAFVQLSAAEMHLKTLYEKTIAEMENGLVDMSDSKVRNAMIEKANTYLDDIERTAEMRRHTMLCLFNLFDGDKDVWCMVKHLGTANMQLWESWQASDNDPELLQLAMESNGMFVRYITQFLGMEISECAACLSDMLKGEDNAEANKKL